MYNNIWLKVLLPWYLERKIFENKVTYSSFYQQCNQHFCDLSYANLDAEVTHEKHQFCKIVNVTMFIPTPSFHLNFKVWKHISSVAVLHFERWLFFIPKDEHC